MMLFIPILHMVTNSMLVIGKGANPRKKLQKASLAVILLNPISIKCSPLRDISIITLNNKPKLNRVPFCYQYTPHMSIMYSYLLIIRI